MPEPETPQDPKYVLYPLPEAPVQDSQRRLRRTFRRGYAFAVVFHSLCAVLGVISVPVSLWLGETSAAAISACAAVFAVHLALLEWWGSDGARGKFHMTEPLNCAMRLEEHERERYATMMTGVTLDDIPADRTAEYTRSLDLVSRSYNHIRGVKGDLEDITGEEIGPDLPDKPWSVEFTKRRHVD